MGNSTDTTNMLHYLRDCATAAFCAMDDLSDLSADEPMQWVASALIEYCAGHGIDPPVV